ncbi:MAG TPA: HU family DNA-binding protein [Gemmataceae bacterium]|jgi:nucleoid DNA-binding protein|nr:HU family DNA-binding protein [Gemmataceae bacterium]
MAKNNATKANRPMTKSAVYQELAEKTQLPRKKVAEVFDALAELIKHQIGKKGPGVFTLPAGLVKIKRAEKKATPARPGRNPQTGEAIMIAAKPKRTVVRALALKSLKQMVTG